MFLYAFRVWVSTLITASLFWVLYFEAGSAPDYGEIAGMIAVYLFLSFPFSLPLFGGFLLATHVVLRTTDTFIWRKSLLSLLFTILYFLLFYLLGFRSISGEDDLQPIMHGYFAVSICFLWIFRLPGSGVTDDQNTDDW